MDDPGDLAKQQGLLGEARDLWSQTEAIFARLIADGPEDLVWRLQLLRRRLHIALLDRDESQFEEARAALSRIRDELRELTRDRRLKGGQLVFTDERSLDALIAGRGRSLRTSG